MRLTTEIFIKKAKLVHGDKYNYNSVNYISTHTLVDIECCIHGIFKQKPTNHLNGSGCTICGGSNQLTTTQFIEKAKNIHGEKYDYSLVDYINAHTKIKIICTSHGIFEQEPQSHLNKCGCPICRNIKFKQERILSTDEFIERSKLVHGDIYDYSLVDYNGFDKNVIIICKKHGEFKQRPNNHLFNKGCPICKISKGELVIKQYFDKLNINYIQQKRFKDCKNKKPLPFDFYLPDHNICIEFDGEQHYRKDSKYYTVNVVKHDKIKDEWCVINNIRLIRIPYTQFDEIENILINSIT